MQGLHAMLAFAIFEKNTGFWTLIILLTFKVRENKVLFRKLISHRQSRIDVE